MEHPNRLDATATVVAGSTPSGTGTASLRHSSPKPEQDQPAWRAALANSTTAATNSRIAATEMNAAGSP